MTAAAGGRPGSGRRPGEDRVGARLLGEPVPPDSAGPWAEATRLVLGDAGVDVPLDAVAVRSYADKPQPRFNGWLGPR
jgi:hypothetical protein